MIFDIVKLTIFVGISLRVSALGCESGWFGSMCQFKCHCKTNTQCDAKGLCPNGCDDGYFGEKCQYVDYYRPLDQNTYNDDGACNFNQKKLTQFDMSYFTWARFTFEDFVPSFVSIFFRDHTMTQFMDCKKYYITFVDSKTFDYYCQPYLSIRDLFIFSNFGSAKICKMYMSRGRNLALKQQATDAITVDGDTGNSNCLNSSSWRVVFPYSSSVNNIIIHSTKGTDFPTIEIYYKVAEDSDWEKYDGSRFTATDGVYVSDPLEFRPPVTDLEIRIVDELKINFCEVEVIGGE
ncbi:uncharacterized protein LOC131940777 [Physella acuta]|uniref:uncharacterized protein LOC131940777 n=1 Tax=Physella acuta TaxID=109671 RepID=UPI0027DC12F3|nr:uncharacterized protein LOC131940777 [Physella acuta]